MLDAAPMPRTIAAESDTPPILPLTAEGLVFEAGGARLIDGVDLTLTHGPKTVILGPNGAGKSLLLRLLHGLIEPTSGAVLWNGRRPDRTVRLRQAMVFQRPVLLRRSAAANLRHALRTRDLPAKRGKNACATGSAVRGSTRSRTGRPASSPAASSNASRWRGRSASVPKC